MLAKIEPGIWRDRWISNFGSVGGFWRGLRIPEKTGDGLGIPTFHVDVLRNGGWFRAWGMVKDLRFCRW